jgi:hypothetical protein
VRAYDPLMLHLVADSAFRSARGSILASIVRIIPASGRMRKVAYGACVVFALFYVVTITQFIWVCETHLQRAGGCVLMFFAFVLTIEPIPHDLDFPVVLFSGRFRSIKLPVSLLA